MFYKFKEKGTKITLNTIFFIDMAIKFKYIKLHADELQLVKETFSHTCKQLIFLPNIEVLELEYFTVNRDFYDVLLL